MTKNDDITKGLLKTFCQTFSEAYTDFKFENLHIQVTNEAQFK